MEKDGVRPRSFRYEDYSTRRVFLRSYPLHRGTESEGEESRAAPAAAKDSKEAPARVTNRTNGNKPIKKIILAVIQWGEERVLVFRRFKYKISISVVNCVPITFKAPYCFDFS